MQIRLRNEIQLDQEIEVIDQVYPVEVTEKNGQIYLIYQNEDDEKVVLKCGELELVMTRFSNPKSVMRFIADQQALVHIPTPVGVQSFVTDTFAYQLDRSSQLLSLSYHLKQGDGEAIFATYQLEIKWQ